MNTKGRTGRETFRKIGTQLINLEARPPVLIFLFFLAAHRFQFLSFPAHRLQDPWPGIVIKGFEPATFGSVS